MTEDARPGLIRVVYFQQTCASMMAGGAVLSEGLLLVLIGAAHRLETLLVGAVAVALVSLLLLPLRFRLPARLRRTYEHAVRIDSAEEQPHTGQDAAQRLSLRRTAGFVGGVVCWMMLIGLATHQLMPPLMLVPMAVVQWAQSRATAKWERVNGADLWQTVPGLLGTRGPVFRVPAKRGI
ncbi:hypothetical protein FNH09_08265 [Streptomyces adustus]|uniref:Uncharacterized protein n=1 Tax=Streptomyces adustus TaxID=1609272 RepID=A0A5N8V7V3_9ACTN|nr:hypothetical protein [Streptomyces adustus]MPY31293.1 hypothetical protein [Streptomyces adustus]